MPRLEDIPLIGRIYDGITEEGIQGIPIIGDLYGAGNAIIDFYESDCRPSWDVYVKTLFPALGTLVIAFLSFGLSDILRGYFRPTGTRGFGFLNRGRRVKTGRPRTRLGRYLGKIKIPEIGNLIGKKLPGATFFRGLPVGNKMNWFWSVSDVFARAGLYWLIADITEDFVINWTTALYHSPECANPKASHCSYRIPPAIGGFGGGGWQILPYPCIIEDGEGGCPITFPMPITGTPSLSFWASGYPYGLPKATSFQLGVRNYYNHDLMYATSPLVPIEEGKVPINRTWARLPGPGYYQTVIRTDGGAIMINDGELHIDISYPDEP